MDPVETLKLAREALETANNADDKEDCFEALEELARHFENIDRWMSKGGFSPWNIPQK